MTGQQPSQTEREASGQQTPPGCRIIMYIITIMAAVSCVVPLCLKIFLNKVLQLSPLLN